ncbi:MAG: hypothetical protein ACE5HT_05355 [Gemmatimonadales bacterium]
MSDATNSVARSDSAVHWFRHAVSLDSTWPEGWVGLGEAYTHLLPRGPQQDSLADVAFATAYELTNGFAPVLFHLVEEGLRSNRLDYAANLLEEFRRSKPDSESLAILELMYRCVAESPNAIDWYSIASKEPEAVFQSAHWWGYRACFRLCA